MVINALGSSVQPYTCRIPKQIVADQKRFIERFDTIFWALFVEDGSRLQSELAFLHGISPVVRPLPDLHDLWVLPHLKRRDLEALADAVLIRREGGFHVLKPREIC